MVTALVATMSGVGFAQTAATPKAIDSCTDIEEPGEYVLTEDLVFYEEGACIHIQSSDVSLNGGGHVIKGDVIKALNGGIAIRAAYFDRLSNVTVTNVSVTSFHDAIRYQGVTDGRIADVRVRHSRYGIRLLRQTDVGPTRQVVVEDNRITNSTYDGVAVLHSNDNIVMKNTVIGNDQTGIRLNNATDTTVTGNIANGNGETGVYVHESDNSVLVDNTATSNVEGIRVERSDDCTVTDNTANRNRGGIVIERSDDCTVTDSIASTNQDGIIVGESTAPVITGNIANSNDDGITIGSVVQYYEQGTGYMSSGSVNVTLEENVANENWIGIQLITKVENSTLADNTANSNYIGFSLSQPRTNVLTGNVANQNDLSGIHLGRGRNNTLVDNAATGNGETGIVSSSSNDMFADNTASENRKHGIELRGDNSTLTDTIASRNAVWDFYLIGSNNRIEDLTLAPRTTVSFRGAYVGLRSVPSPPGDPAGFGNTGAFVNATNLRTYSWLFLNVSYTEPALNGRDESTLGLWSYDEDDMWSPVSGSGTHTARNYVYANITDFSVFAPFAELVSPRIETDLTPLLTESDAATAQVTISDPDSTAWTVAVDYGDSSPPISLELDEPIFTLNHTYADDGTYTVTIDVCDDRDMCGNTTRRVTVENAPPVVDATATDAPPGEPVFVNASFTDPGETDTHTVEIAWGDGTVESIPVNEQEGVGTFSASRTYSEAGTYTIEVRVVDDDGGVGTATVTVMVASATPTKTSTPAPPTKTAIPATPPKTSISAGILTPMSTKTVIADSTTTLVPPRTMTATPVASLSPTTASGSGFGMGIAVLALVVLVVVIAIRRL